MDDSAASAPVVSALEAGRQEELASARKAVTRVVSPRRVPAAASPELTAADQASRLHPSVTATTSSMEHMTMAAMPAAAPAAGPAAEPSRSVSSSWPIVAEHGRDPAIIIRGGMGGARDDCDLHRRGAGIAVNRSTWIGGVELGRGGMPLPRGTRIR